MTVTETLAERIARLRGWELTSTVWNVPAEDTFSSERHAIQAEDGAVLYVWMWNPENDWAQCGVLLEELIEAERSIHLYSTLDGDLYVARWRGMTRAGGPNLRTAICKAWCVMKESEA